MSTLYVTRVGSRIRKTKRRLVVSGDEGVIQTARLRDLRKVVLVGSAGVTTPALLSMLEAGIEVSFLTGSGRPRGRLVPAEGKNVFLRVIQFRRFEDMDFRIAMARRIVSAKIQNARRILQLFRRDRTDLDFSGPLAELKILREKAEQQQNLSSLMGIEGDAAARYFRCFGCLFLQDLSFEKRSRRPPMDPVNALLSLGYTLIAGETQGALSSLALDPYIGFFHELDYGRPSLALDLEEEFRQPIVDRFVLSLCNRRILKPEDFQKAENGGTMLKEGPRKKFFRFYEKMMMSPMGASSPEAESMTLRKLIHFQAENLKSSIISGSEYSPYVMR
jgi:CRISPR-associated protein Cas1